MKKQALILHAYSSRNAGDGLLVDETLSLVREALGDETMITLAASDPGSFAHLLGVDVLDSQPTIRGYKPDYLRTLINARRFDLVVAVGGGYLRFGNLTESLKALAVHGPQVVAAGRSSVNSVYLPQSIGPTMVPLRGLLRRRIQRLGRVYLRDSTSLGELKTCPNVVRTPDLAVLTPYDFTKLGTDVDKVPILSVRFLNGALPQPVVALAESMGRFDGFVQSAVRGNSDQNAVDQTKPRHVIDRSDLMTGDAGPRRVIVAMRLHAALMAIRSGHYVIHLAYERKGWAAFQDLGLPQYVHNARNFDVQRVQDQIDRLLNVSWERDRYRQSVEQSARSHSTYRAEIVESLRKSLKSQS